MDGFWIWQEVIKDQYWRKQWRYFCVWSESFWKGNFMGYRISICLRLSYWIFGFLLIWERKDWKILPKSESKSHKWNCSSFKKKIRRKSQGQWKLFLKSFDDNKEPPLRKNELSPRKRNEKSPKIKYNLIWQYRNDSISPEGINLKCKKVQSIGYKAQRKKNKTILISDNDHFSNFRYSFFLFFSHFAFFCQLKIGIIM